MQLYHSVVHLYFIYRLTVWDNTFPTCIFKLHKLQNKAVRIVAEISWNETATLLYQINKKRSFLFAIIALSLGLALWLQPQAHLQILWIMQFSYFNHQLWKQLHEVWLWDLKQGSTNNKRVAIYELSKSTTFLKSFLDYQFLHTSVFHL